MTFDCTGLITKFIFGAILQNGSQAPEFQIWKQLDQGIFFETTAITIYSNTSIATNLYEFVPQIPVLIFERDLFGLYVPGANTSQILIYEQELSGPLNLKTVPGSSILLVEEENNFPLITPVVSECIKLISIPSFAYRLHL